MNDELAERDISAVTASVKRFADGSARGSMTGIRQLVHPYFTDVPALKLFPPQVDALNAICLYVDGNQAWVGVVDDAFGGWPGLVFVIEHNGAAGVNIAPAVVPAAACDTQPGPAVPFWTSTHGNFTIMQR